MFDLQIGPLLRRARRGADMSQRQLAAAAGTRQSLISRIESASDGAGVSVEIFSRLLAAAGCTIVLINRDGEPLIPLPDGPRDRAGRRYPAHLDVRDVRNIFDWWAWRRPSATVDPQMPDQTFDLDREVRDWRREHPGATESPHPGIAAAEQIEQMKRRRRDGGRRSLPPVGDDYWIDDVDP